MYQDSLDLPIFRYDNAPHHPEIMTHPHHKHVVAPGDNLERLEPAAAPHLGEVLREIEHYLDQGDH